MTLRLACAIVCAATLFRFGVTPLFAAEARLEPNRRPESTELLRLAAARFSNLTNCERALLINADVNTKSHQGLAVCGPSPKFDDPGNDPKGAALWDHQREIRAELIRWLCVDPNAIKLIQPDGISVIGASVVGSLNLDYVHPPFGVRLVRSSIADLMSL